MLWEFSAGLHLLRADTGARCRPYALGCIAASSLATMSFLACLFVLPETHPRYRKPAAAYQPLDSDSLDTAEDEQYPPGDQGVILFPSQSLSLHELKQF